MLVRINRMGPCSCHDPSIILIDSLCIPLFLRLDEIEKMLNNTSQHRNGDDAFEEEDMCCAQFSADNRLVFFCWDI